jgi:hypothetical protein
MLKQWLDVGVGVPVSEVRWWVPQRRLEGHAGLWEPWETLRWAETQNGGRLTWGQARYLRGAGGRREGLRGPLAIPNQK